MESSDSVQSLSTGVVTETGWTVLDLGVGYLLAAVSLCRYSPALA